jgi:uncharacterized membrane protein YqjE
MPAEQDNDAAVPRTAGLFASLRDLLTTLLAIAHTRLELATTEVEEQLHRVAGILLWSLIALFCGGVTVLLLALSIVVACWEDHRLLAALLVTAGFLLITLLAGLVVWVKARARPKLLQATLDELRHDRDALEGHR